MENNIPCESRYDKLIAKYDEYGFGSLSTDEASELFLCFAMHQKDVSELYQVLKGLDTSSIFDLTCKKLEKNGVPKSASFLILSFPEIANHLGSLISEKLLVDTSPGYRTEAESILVEEISSRFIGVREERVLLILFDRQNHICFADFVTKGLTVAYRLTSRESPQAPS